MAATGRCSTCRPNALAPGKMKARRARSMTSSSNLKARAKKNDDLPPALSSMWRLCMLGHMYMSLFSTCGWILRLGVTIALLMSIHPALALLAVFAVPTVLTSTWRPAVERSAYERGASAGRLARHLFDTATTATPGKEVRVTGIGDRLIRERR